MSKEFGELAFEHDMDIDSPPEVLWRVMAIREWSGRQVRHVNWFVTEAAARKHAAWIDDGRGKVAYVAQYQRQ